MESDTQRIALGLRQGDVAVLKTLVEQYQYRLDPIGFLERTSAAAEIPRCIMVRSSAARSAFDPRCEWGSITSSANRRSPTPACFLNHENQVLALKQLILEFRRSTCI